MSMMEKLDHPLPFLFFMLLALWGLKNVVKSGAKRMGWNGVAAFFN